jgi:hypothetical protein
MKEEIESGDEVVPIDTLGQIDVFSVSCAYVGVMSTKKPAKVIWKQRIPTKNSTALHVLLQDGKVGVVDSWCVRKVS